MLYTCTVRLSEKSFILRHISCRKMSLKKCTRDAHIGGIKYTLVYAKVGYLYAFVETLKAVLFM